MHKKIALGVGVLMIFSPLVASAQTTGSSSLLATLEALVQQLEQELQQLIAAKNLSPAPNPSNPTPAPSQCAQFANLERGDTDATTGGQVSQLQAFLGISPTTGYYGAQTSIGYQNKCGNLGNAQPSSVPGMSEYTDSDFGFSFWYPSTWSVQASNPEDAVGIVEINGTSVPSALKISDGTNAIYAIEISSPSGVRDICGKCADHLYFDSTKGAWMDNSPGWTSETGLTNANLHEADTSVNTMGGLHIFWNNVIPLSADNFVAVGAYSSDGSLSALPLAKTIVATNPNVATPVSTSQQIATIQAEANAYSSNDSVTYTNSTSFSGSPISGPAPLSVTFSASGVPSGASVNFGDGTTEQLDALFGMGTTNAAGYCGAGPDFFCSITHTYASAGTYTATLVNSSGTAIGTTVVTVTHSSGGSLQTYTNSQYGFTLQYPSGDTAQTSGYDSIHPFANPPVAYLYVGSQSNVDAAYLTVNVSSNPTDVNSCSIPGKVHWVDPNTYDIGHQSSPHDTSSSQINGTSFAESDWGSPDPSGLERDYSAVHDGLCYDLELITIPSCSLCTDGPEPVSQQYNALNEVDSIAKTFRFTQ